MCKGLEGREVRREEENKNKEFTGSSRWGEVEVDTR